jgi:hypothetical protein
LSHGQHRKENNCLNCGAEVIGKFCHNCGQPNIEPKETVWQLINHFFADITHFDGKIFSSLRLVILKPGFLSKQYILGKRMSYLHPIRMYLFVSAIFFLIFFSVVKINEKNIGATNYTSEQELIKGSKGKKYLYYYDDKNRLTDVVHFNERAKRLLPDYMYEYNQLGQVRQLIATEDGSSNYFIWKYTYNDRKLRETETCLSKQKRLLGSIQYQYK